MRSVEENFRTIREFAAAYVAADPSAPPGTDKVVDTALSIAEQVCTDLNRIAWFLEGIAEVQRNRG